MKTCGAWTGTTIPGDANNPKGYFEHGVIRERIVKNILRDLDCDPLGVTRLPPADHSLSVDGLVEALRSAVETDGYRDDVPWLLKDAKLVLVWTAFRKAFPRARWVIVRRSENDFVRSCLRTSFMVQHSNDPMYWQRFHSELQLRIDRLKASGAELFEVSAENLVSGELGAFQNLIQSLDLIWREEQVRDFIDPNAWHASSREDPAGLAHRAIDALSGGDPERALELLESPVRAPNCLTWIRRYRGMALLQAGRLDDAVTEFGNILEEDPTDDETAYCQALALIATGDDERGWQLYTRRWGSPGFSSPRKTPKRPVWDGNDIGRLLVWREQGVGDEVMFARNLPTAKHQCQTMTYECDPRLAPLYRRSFKDLDVAPIANGELIPNVVDDTSFDAHIPAGTLPSLYPTGFSEPAAAYLVPNRALAKSLRDQLQQRFPGKRLVGISWHSRNATEGRGRSVNLLDLEPVLRAPNHVFISLQYGDVQEELEHLQSTLRLHVHRISNIDPWHALDNFIALIAAMDRVVTIDNNTVHFAGAIGAPTHLMLPHYHDWRWHLPTSAGPGALYESVVLHRQRQQGEWASLAREVRDDLDARP